MKHKVFRGVLLALLIGAPGVASAGEHRTSGLPPRVHTICVPRDAPTTQDEYVATIHIGGTIQKFWCIATGTIGTAATVTLNECTSLGASCTQNNTAALSCDADGDATVAFAGAAGATVDAEDWMRLDITNTSTTTGRLTACFTYAEN